MLPARPVLLPGLAVVRRDDRHLQAGVDPPHCAVLRDEPDVHRVLARLRAGEPAVPETEAGVGAVERLAAAGLLEDRDEVDRRRAARSGVTVGLDGPADLVPQVVDRLRAVDLAVASRSDQASVLLVLRDGLVPRDHLDRCVRDGLPHLLVAAEPGGVSVGPFVEPGRTACLRCVDAHLGTADPRRALLLEQVDVGVPRATALQAVALAWAVADLVAWAEGRTPSTWSATIRWDASLAVRRTSWTRHPGCGCAWDAL